MSTKGEDFAGVSVALTTPFRDGEVDYNALKQQIEFQIEAGTRCLCPAGTTGESPTLSHEEHERLISTVVQIAAGRAKVMAGTGSNSTAEALRLTDWAAKEGADGALVVAPYYNKPTQQGFYEHYKALAEQCGIPLCVYNIPSRTGRLMETETLVRASQIHNIVGVKDAAGNLEATAELISRAAPGFYVWSGDDSYTLPLLSIGFWRYSRRYKDGTTLVQEELGRATALVEETVTGIRVVKGLGAGAMQPISMTIIGDLFDVHERAKVQGAVGACRLTTAIGDIRVGQAADVPPSTGLTPEPAKWLKAARSGLRVCKPPGPCDEYPSRRSVTVTAATVTTSGWEFAPWMLWPGPVSAVPQRRSGQGPPQFPAAKNTSAPAATRPPVI